MRGAEGEDVAFPRYRFGVEEGRGFGRGGIAGLGFEDRAVVVYEDEGGGIGGVLGAASAGVARTEVA